MRICSFEGCDKPVRGKQDLCKAHCLQRWRNPDKPLKPLTVWMQGGGVCSFQGCGLPVRAKGLCNGHWCQYHKHPERPLKPLRQLEVARGRACSAEGCNLPVSSKGLCKKHYDKKWRKDNKERKRENDRKYHKKYAKKHRSTNSKWQKDNPERRKIIRKRYLQTENGRFHSRANCRKRRERLGSKITPKMEMDLRKENIQKFGQLTDEFTLQPVYDDVKRNKSNKLNVDHIVPINKGGTNDYNNLAIISFGTNIRKQATLIPDLIHKQTFLDFIIKNTGETWGQVQQRLMEIHNRSIKGIELRPA